MFLQPWRKAAVCVCKPVSPELKGQQVVAEGAAKHVPCLPPKTRPTKTRHIDNEVSPRRLDLLPKVLGRGSWFCSDLLCPACMALTSPPSPPQVGMNDLMLVNLHLALPPSAGENTGKNHDSHKLAAFAQTLQETLKGRAAFFLLAIACVLASLSHRKECFKK